MVFAAPRASLTAAWKSLTVHLEMKKRYALIVLVASSLLVQPSTAWCSALACSVAKRSVPACKARPRCCSQGNLGSNTGRPCSPCKQCCCTGPSTDRLPPSTKKVPKNWSVLATFSTVQSPPVLYASVACCCGQSFPPTHQLHVFNCLWLC